MEDELGTIERVHRSMSSTLLWLTLLFFFLLLSFLSNVGFTIDSLPGIFCIALFIGGMSVYFGFSRRRIWAYKFAIVHWICLILVCSLISLLDLRAGINGDIMAAIMAAMLIYITFGMVKRFSTFSNPLFVAWYIGQGNNILASSKLNDDEMMGACPNCLSILAVKPIELSSEDLCPNCGERLVSQAFVEKFNLEEE
ncbi:MAG: hypothetical protein HOE69_03920 [Euryarchaeota archaeon]|nr:hypothetical protein [Euryarchaeota archaeon]